jgi:hypothetical protein
MILKRCRLRVVVPMAGANDIRPQVVNRRRLRITARCALQQQHYGDEGGEHAAAQDIVDHLPEKAHAASWPKAGKGSTRHLKQMAREDRLPAPFVASRSELELRDH